EKVRAVAMARRGTVQIESLHARREEAGIQGDAGGRASTLEPQFRGFQAVIHFECFDGATHVPDPTVVCSLTQQDETTLDLRVFLGVRVPLVWSDSTRRHCGECPVESTQCLGQRVKVRLIWLNRLRGEKHFAKTRDDTREP